MSDVIVEAHIACPVEGCGSSDGFTWYEDHGFCFVCRTRVNHGPNGEVSQGTAPTTSKKPSNLVGDLTIVDLTKRGLSKETCQKYGYALGRDRHGTLVQVAPYRDQAGRVVAQKLRTADKQFSTTGDFKDVQLFGQHLWRAGGKRLVITEGEIDALSVYQMLGSWAVVSVPNGAQGAAKAVATNLEFVESYESVIICFDQDKPGQDAADAVASLLTPGRAKIMSLPRKDANEMLLANEVAEFTKCFWEAKAFEPDGIVSGADLWDQVCTDPEWGPSLPWDGLNRLTYGQRPGELWTWASGSGMGKSEFVSDLAFHNLVTHGEVIGYVALEENCGRTGKRLMAKYLKTPIHIPGHAVSLERKREAFNATTGSGRVWLYDHWGSQDGDKLIAKLRFMIKAKKCTTIILDHLSIVVSGLDDGDERKTIDVLMTALRSLVEETGVKMHLVTHLKRPPKGKGHEEGAQVSLAHLRGSHSIAQLSDFVIGLERNQQSKSKSNVTKLRLLKNRYTGDTGLAAAVEYDKATGMLNEVELVEDEEERKPIGGEDFDDY